MIQKYFSKLVGCNKHVLGVKLKYFLGSTCKHIICSHFHIKKQWKAPIIYINLNAKND